MNLSNIKRDLQENDDCDDLSTPLNKDILSVPTFDFHEIFKKNDQCKTALQEEIMKNKIFTTDFLDDLEEEFKDCGLIEIVMDFCDLSFHDAVLRIAHYCDMEPKYCEKKCKCDEDEK